MAVTVYGINFLGRDVVKGYGSVLIPLSVGIHEIYIPMYTPLAVSMFNQWMSWWMGNPPEFYDSKFVCEGEGREVTRVMKTGTVNIQLNVLTKGLQSAGYSF
jgi:B9 domain-containing protein 1